ncbi:ATP synthase subunit ATP5MJ, mitochondrial [Dendropsophus ebraccatus]|uniref:ATP synthase subunit ATP5MJ, mitochondrial n=1 Tax=Dendropsophus ebraccatus TaxID=150705 RepID=UPI00383197CA
MAKLVSLNVKGLNSNVKRRLALRELRNVRADVAFLQETHFDSAATFSFTRQSYPIVVSASKGSKTAGVAILFSRSFPFQISSSFSDPGGRYVIVEGTLQGKPLLFCNVYAPNRAQIPFLRRVLNKLAKYPPAPRVVGGDFNLPFSDVLDRHSVTGRIAPPEQARLSREFRKLVRKHKLYDLWMLDHPTEREYTFYSHPHRMHSRIDYFFGNIPTVRLLQNATIDPISWWDHGPVIISLKSLLTPTRYCHWRLNESLLKFRPTRDSIKTSIQSYFLENGGSVESEATLWEAHKAVIRGQCIALSSRQKRDSQMALSEAKQDILALERSLARRSSLRTLRRLVAARARLKELSIMKVEKLLLYSKQRFFEKGNKAHTLLANMLNDRAASRSPQVLRDSTGALKFHPTDIASLFSQYYTNLYSLPSALPSGPGARADRINEFLSGCQLPSLPPNAIEDLNAPVTGEELAEVLKSLPSGRAPGPDGFSYLYYKTFSEELSPRLLALFNSFLQGEPIPSSLSHSYITLIPKPGKDHMECANYRPISLLNSDFKLFTKILATRLGYWLPSLINADQVGFVPGRQGGDNTRRALDIIDAVNQQSGRALILSLDAEKAFDRLGWPFLFETLKCFGIRGPFLTAVEALYSTPTAAIKFPHMLSAPFPIRNGTRQGCPLSPLLFVLCIEPLAAAIRGCPDIHGVSIRGKDSKIMLFADDVLLTLSDPVTTLPVLHDLLTKFGTLSGYKVNTTKSEAMPLNLPSSLVTHLRTVFKFKWTPSSLGYLGIRLTPSYSTVYSANFPSLFREIRSLLSKWSAHFISLLGRVASVKMTILPKLLYYFETLPVRVPLSELRAIQRDIFKFIWASRRHRIPKSVMMSNFLPGLQSQTVRLWGTKKLFQFADIVDPLTRTLLPFDKLMDRSDLPSSERLTYLQMRHFMMSRLGSLTVSKPSAFEQLMLGKAFAAWWSVAKPYYTKAYQELFIGIPIMGYIYYKLSYGGKKAVKDSSKYYTWLADHDSQTLCKFQGARKSLDCANLICQLPSNPITMQMQR